MSNSRIEHGDFQTPISLAREVCLLLHDRGLSPSTVVEPTCGTGSFVAAAIETWKHLTHIHAYDLNREYVAETLRTVSEVSSSIAATVEQADFFNFDWIELAAQTNGPTLFLGNPPWVTNAVLGSLSSQNLPTKSNFQNHRGYDAITGKSNFDIAEWMLIRLGEALTRAHGGDIAMLCKTSTARKVLLHGWKTEHSIEHSELFHIDAKRHFGVATDACLVWIRYSTSARNYTCSVFRSFNEGSPAKKMGIVGNQLIADVRKYETTKSLYGNSYFRWRSGVKHDAAKIMELTRTGKALTNGLGEIVDIEDDYLFPLLKSSDLGNGRLTPRKYVIVTQRRVGEATDQIADHAPHTWAYLLRHKEQLDSRRSAIYRDKPSFAVFGIGPYTYADWKVAISGLYKTTKFHVLGPVSRLPVMVDDTCYFVACESEEQAEWVAMVLNSKPAQDLLDSLVFLDAKRPVNVDILNKIDLKKVAEVLGESDAADRLLSGAELPSEKQHDFVFER